MKVHERTQQTYDKVKKNGINITLKQMLLLFASWFECDIDDKSTEYMLSYMSDVADVDYDVVVDFIGVVSSEDRSAWYDKELKPVIDEEE